MLSLEPNGKSGGGSLNHLGIRLGKRSPTGSVQERLEKRGVRSQREEGVECCYAKQTKFWVQDPDNTLWEFYTLDDDSLDRRGVGQSLEVMTSSTLPDDAVVLGASPRKPIPVRIDACDGSIDEVRLRGSFNLPTSPEDRERLITEAARVLKRRVVCFCEC